ncbi:hypothetical protein CEXT_682281 [Caerostris extrusa]|uniref:Transmembrane protein n=1 Tax=Caerostris extrusa TaxID=172846 RepID=A0AAV4YAQ9_CAEEX|nr:hypothetical protein CEXT_682281 [Caerostris extrusa]
MEKYEFVQHLNSCKKVISILITYKQSTCVTFKIMNRRQLLQQSESSKKKNAKKKNCGNETSPSSRSLAFEKITFSFLIILMYLAVRFGNSRHSLENKRPLIQSKRHP